MGVVGGCEKFSTNSHDVLFGVFFLFCFLNDFFLKIVTQEVNNLLPGSVIILIIVIKLIMFSVALVFCR